MSKKKVSGKTHTKKQLDDYANQHNPNNKAYYARMANEAKQKRRSKKSEHRNENTWTDLDWYCGDSIDLYP